MSGRALQLCDLGAGQSPSLSLSVLGSSGKVARCSPREVAPGHRGCDAWKAGHASPSQSSSRSVPLPGLIPARLLHAVRAGVPNHLPSSPALTLSKPSLSTYLESPRTKSPFQVFISRKALPDPLKLETTLLSTA